MERRRLETRAKLLAATEQLVVKKGIDKTTMDDITNTADLGRRTLYYHFSSKEECVVAAVTGVYEKHATTAQDSAAGGEDPALVVARSARTVVSGLLAEPITARLADYPKLLAMALQQSLSRFAARDIQRGIDEQRFRLSVNQTLLNSMMIWSIVGLIMESVAQTISHDELAQAYSSMLLTSLGLTPSEARQISELAAREVAD